MENISKILDPLDEFDPRPDGRPTRIRLYSSKAMKLEGIPTTELFITGKKYSCRNYGLRTPADMDTVTRAAVLIRALCLTSENA